MGTVKFEQGVIKVEKEREFGDLKAAIEKAFAADRVTKYLKELGSRKHSSPRPGCGFRGGCDRPGGGREGWNGAVFVQSLPVSDQAQVREFYLSKVEEVDPALRAKFHKLYQYY